jgi:hypothetical protein
LIVAGSDGAIDLEVSDHAFDAVALTIKALAVADFSGAVGFRRDNGFDAALLEIAAVS